MTITPDYAGLIARLDAVKHGSDRPYAASVAADAIQIIRALLESNAALERKSERWAEQAMKEDECRVMWQTRAEAAEARVKDLEARLAEAERALEPFAMVAEEVSSAFSDDDVLSNIAGKRQLTAGDFRAARAYRDKGRG